MASVASTFNRPEARNAFTLAMYEQLQEIVQQAQEQIPSVRVLVLTGAGDKAFAAGTDISEFRMFSTSEHALNYEAGRSAYSGRRAPLSLLR